MLEVYVSLQALLGLPNFVAARALVPEKERNMNTEDFFLFWATHLVFDLLLSDLHADETSDDGSSTLAVTRRWLLSNRDMNTLSGFMKRENKLG